MCCRQALDGSVVRVLTSLCPEGNCQICFEALDASSDAPATSSQQTGGTTSCGHVYHTSCLEQWLNQKPECPVCRATMSRSRARMFTCASHGGNLASVDTQAVPVATDSTASGAHATGLPQAPVLHNWYYNRDGTISGRVYGKAGFSEGVMIDTSFVPMDQRFHDHVITCAGTLYRLGKGLD